MNNDFPPLQFVAPQFQKRRPEKPRRAPLPEELIVRRAEVARVLGVKVQHLSRALRQVSDDERRAVFYKLTHEAPVDLTGTGLKPIVERSRHVTLAVPRSDNLDQFDAKLQQFGSATPGPRGHLPHQDLAFITDIAPGEPKDRLSDELCERYDDLIKQDSLLCEIEIISLRGGSRQQREEIASILYELRTAFASGVHGTLFEHESIRASCRAVIRCTGRMFQRLVEERNWHTKLSWFEPKPQFETFQSVWNNFRVDDLRAIEPPDENAPTVCIVDSGVSAGNPFLEKVAREDLLRSFLREPPGNPFDECGHGSGVASLAAYYALNLDKAAVNRGRVWIASARILSHQLTPATVYDYGTSLAAPRVSHRLALVLKDLQEIGVTHVSAPLLKAFLVNSAAYRGDPDCIGPIQDDLRDGKHWLNVCGYGFADHVRATYCDDYSVVLYYQGEIAADEVAYFDLPVPATIGDSTGGKRLTVTVSHYPEVQRWGLERYLGADLKWRMFRGDVSRDEIVAAMSQEEQPPDGEEQEENELPNELKFELGITRRSRGAVQHDIFEWKQHRDAFSENHYTLAIAAYKRWQRSVAPVPVGIVVRIEDLGRTAKVYSEVQAILAELQVQAKART